MSRRTRSRAERVVASSTTGERSDRRLELGEVVAELVTRFVDEPPADHRCSPGCTHGPLAELPLLARLQMLVLKGSSAPRPEEGGGKGGKKAPAGSPAPWSAQAAELLDEIRRGAADLSAHARRVAGFGPAPEVDDRGHGALSDIVSLLGFLLSRPDLRDHHLASVAPAREDLPRRPGQLEQQLRGWHRRALLLTGHEQPWPALRQIPNPEQWERPAGPLCQDWGCGPGRVSRSGTAGQRSGSRPGARTAAQRR